MAHNGGGERLNSLANFGLAELSSLFIYIYIYLASNTAAPPSFKTRAPHLTQTCIRAHTRCEASLAIGTKGAIERRGSVASILTILDGIKGSQPNHMRASPCF